MASEDVQYYLTRAQDERPKALEADQPNVAEIHLELARQYEELARRSHSQRNT